MSLRRGVAKTVIFSLLASSLAASASGAPQAAGPAQRCGALSDIAIAGGKVTGARYVEGVSGPSYCEVTATVGKQLDITLRMPDGWKGRYLQLGGGGFDGSTPNLNAAPAAAIWSQKIPLNEGYAVIASNGGHRAADYPGVSFSTDREMMLSYAGVKIYDTDRVGRAMVETYYGEPAKYRYFAGCSNGGRNAATAAAYYSDDYDGVIGAAGVWGKDGDAAGSVAGHFAMWISTAQVTPIIPPAKGAALMAAQMTACDGLDGAKDGLISNPEACTFKPESVACKAGDTSATCLTPDELASVKRYRSEVKVNGHVVGSSWGLVNPSSLRAATGFASGHIGMYRGTGKNEDPNSVDLEKDYPAMRDFFEGAMSMSGDLNSIRSYLAKGKKLMLTQGWDDTTVPSNNSVNFYNALRKKGSAKEVANARLYMEPGVGHCQGGAGPDQSELLDAMSRWVELGKAPETANLQVWKRATPEDKSPLCAYPATMVTTAGVRRCVTPPRRS